MTGWKVALVDRVARALVWAGRFVKGWLPRTLGGASALALVIWGVLDDQVWKPLGVTLFWVGVALAVLAFFAEMIVQRPSYMQLSKLREQAELNANGKSEALERAIRILLIRLGHHLELTGHSDRFSVYYFHDGEFVRIARHAKNPTYASAGRMRYPEAVGVIGTAWQEPGGQALGTMPQSKDQWRRAAKRQGFADEVIDKMTMKSVSLGGHRLETESTSVGVLIIESTTAHRINQTHLDKIAESHIVAALAELVGAFAMMTPAGESIASAAKPAKYVGKWQAVPPRAAISAGSQ